MMTLMLSLINMVLKESHLAYLTSSMRLCRNVRAQLSSTDAGGDPSAFNVGDQTQNWMQDNYMIDPKVTESGKTFSDS